MYFSIIDTSSSVDWTLKHGRGIALGIALKEGADKIWTDQYKAGVKTAISSLVESDRVSLRVLRVLFKDQTPSRGTSQKHTNI